LTTTVQQEGDVTHSECVQCVNEWQRETVNNNTHR